MRASKFITAILLVLSPLFATVASFGVLSPEYPRLSSNTSEDVLIMFDELIEMIYFQQNNAGTHIVNARKIDAKSVKFKQGQYKFDGKDYYIVPSEYNRDAIDEFYKYLKRSREPLRKMAFNQKMDMILYVQFDNFALRRIFGKKINPAEITLNTRIYYVQTNQITTGNVKFTVKDLFDFPDFDRNQFESNLSNEFLRRFKEAIGVVDTIGSIADMDSDETKAMETQSSAAESQGVEGW